MKKIQQNIFNKFIKILCLTIEKSQPSVWIDKTRGHLVVFFDFEGKYANGKKEEACLYGVVRILELCKLYNIKATFNTVGQLFYDCPEIIQQIIKDGHDIASHSFKHDDVSQLTRCEIEEDIKLTMQAVEQFGLSLHGMRSPQGRWSFRQLSVMLDNNLVWSAEGDQAKYPYVIYKKKDRKIVRFPIMFGDYRFYISNKNSADEMYQILINAVTHIQNTKIFSAIGFHPWVNGENESRLHTMEKFFEYISKMDGLKTLTFQDAYNIIVNG